MQPFSNVNGFRVFGTSRHAAAERSDGITMLTCDVTEDTSVAKQSPIAPLLRAEMEVQMRKSLEGGDDPEVVAETVVKAATAERREDVTPRENWPAKFA